MNARRRALVVNARRRALVVNARRRALVLALAVAPCARAAGDARLTIAAASDLRVAMPVLLAPWSAVNRGIEIEVVYGASGKLAAQIRQGAPFDLFFSADLAFAQTLQAEGHAATAPQVYARGRLASWSLDAALGRMALPALVRDARVQRLALANPEHAPYGRRAIEALRSQGLEAEARPKLVFGDNVAQAAAFVESGAAQAGLVAHALLLAPALAGRGAFTLVPAAWHSPLEQAFVVTRRAAGSAAAADLARHLESAAARETLRRHGFE